MVAWRQQVFDPGDNNFQGNADHDDTGYQGKDGLVAQAGKLNPLVVAGLLKGKLRQGDAGDIIIVDIPGNMNPDHQQTCRYNPGNIVPGIGHQGLRIADISHDVLDDCDKSIGNHVEVEVLHGLVQIIKFFLLDFFPFTVFFFYMVINFIHSY